MPDPAAADREAENPLNTIGTIGAEVEFPSPRGTPAPADAAPQANEGGTARPDSDQAAGRGAPLTWNRSAEVAKFVPHPRYTAEELKLPATVQAVLEQLSVVQACTESLLTAVGKKPAALTIADSQGLLEELAAAAVLLASEEPSAIMALMVGSTAEGVTLRSPLKWTVETLQPSKDALLRLLSAVRRDVLRFEARSRSLLASQPSQTREPAQQGALALPLKRKKGTKRATAFAEAMQENAEDIDLIQADQLAAMARRGRLEPGAGDGHASPAEGAALGGAVQGLVEAAAAALVAQRDAAAPAQSAWRAGPPPLTRLTLAEGRQLTGAAAPQPPTPAGAPPLAQPGAQQMAPAPPTIPSQRRIGLLLPPLEESRRTARHRGWPDEAAYERSMRRSEAAMARLGPVRPQTHRTTLIRN